MSFKLKDDIPIRLAAFERLTHDCEGQSSKVVDGVVKIVVKPGDLRYHEEPLRKAKTKAKEVGKPTSDLQSAHSAC